MVHGIGLLLLSVVGGYWVLERAAAQKGSLRKVGRFLGWTIIVLSLLGVVCKLSYGFAGAGRGMCPLMKSPWAISPFSLKGSPESVDDTAP